jgi:hypothetical protein
LSLLIHDNFVSIVPEEQSNLKDIFAPGVQARDTSVSQDEPHYYIINKVTAQEVSRFARLGPLLDQADRVGVIHGNAVALVHIGK